LRTLAVFLIGACIGSPAIAQESLEAPREVRIALLLADLSAVHDADQSFSADVLMAASWRDPALAGGSNEVRNLDLADVWHPTLLVYNRRAVTESLPSTVTVQPDGTVTYLQRFTGDFSARLDLREFPLDSHEFYVWVVSPARVGTPGTLVPETNIAALRNQDLSVSDWIIGEATLTSEAFRMAPGAPENSGVKLTVPATRRVTYYTIQVLIPLVAIVLMAYTVFWVAPTVIPTRVGVVVTTMLTLIAYRFMLANHVPRLSYLTRLDWFMLGATVLVILTLFAMAGTAYLMSRERQTVVQKIDRIGRLLYPIVFVGYSLIVWLG